MKKFWLSVICIVTIFTMVGCAGINLDSPVIPAGATQTPTQVAANTQIPQSQQPTAGPTAVPTQAPTLALTLAPTAQSTVEPGKVDLRAQVNQFATGSWKVTTYQGVTDQITNWFKNLKDPAPASWPVFPNVNNPLVNFQSKNGLEYGLDERNYCPQETCDVIVAAGEYNGITADYDFGFLDCSATDTTGCGIMFVNVGEVTANFEQVVVNNGFSVAGRYWNGNELQQAIWGFVSHSSANMLNMATTLNPQGSSNSGANCSVKTGCTAVLWRVVITSGNQILVVAETTVKR